MAQRVQIQLLDDITGEEAAETITFGLDGVSYEIDLTAQNARQLRGEVGVYVEKGRKVRGRSSVQRQSNPRRHLRGMKRAGSVNGQRRTVTAPATGDSSARASWRLTRRPTPRCTETPR